mgnify:CR=1 FL=1
MEIIAILLVFIGFIAMSFFWGSKKDRFLENEANRCLNNFCEVDSTWNSKSRLYTKGLAVVEQDGKKRFVKQAKLCDIGILK